MEIDPAADERHRQLFKQAADLLRDELPLHGKRLAKPGLLLSWRLKKSLRLFDQVLAINPRSWRSLWLQGMVLRRLGRNEESLSRFRRAAEIDPTQPDILREAGITAGLLGQREAALEFAIRASNADPHDDGLLSNVALDTLLLGRVPDAVALVNAALARNPSDPVTKALHGITMHIASGGAACPTSLNELEQLASKLKRTGVLR